MNRSVKPVKVSPFIKGMRWSLLVCGVFYGKIKLREFQALEVTARPIRQQKIKEKYERLRKESGIRDSKELYAVGTEFEIEEFPPGWNDEI